ILNLPFTVQAEQLGMKSLGRTTDLLGPYQAGGVFVMRGWAQAHEAVLERYVAAYIEALRWVRAPANRAESIALLVEKLQISTKEAERTYEVLVDPGFGFIPDAKFDLEGFRNALALRAEIEGGQPAAPERYIDLGYYERALARVGRYGAAGSAGLTKPPLCRLSRAKSLTAPAAAPISAPALALLCLEC